MVENNPQGGGGHGTLANLDNTSNSPIYTALNSFLPSYDSTPGSRPKAYLNWMLLDNQFNYVSGNGQSGAIPVGNPNVLNTLATTIKLKHSGYLYIWVSNETQNWMVFFDNLSVQDFSGPMLEETHYYPFGLAMAGINDKALKAQYAENKYRYNDGSELQNKEFSDGSGLEMYSTELRELDPQLGRWWQIDSKPDYAQSLYSSMFNNPILHNDPIGDSGVKPWPLQVNQTPAQNPQTLVPLGGDNSQASNTGNPSGGSANSGPSAPETKKGDSKGSEPLIGSTTTDKTIDRSGTLFDDGLGDKLTWDAYSGVTTGEEGKIATVDGGTEHGEKDGIVVTVADVEIGTDKSKNVTVGKTFGPAEAHVTAGNGKTVTLGGSHNNGDHTVNGQELTYHVGKVTRGAILVTAGVSTLTSSAAQLGWGLLQAVFK